jgi:putative ABC transport system permease protein
MATRLPWQASLRFYRQHPLQLALTLFGIALGAAVIVAVSLATRAAALSFERSLDALAGPMTHELRARQGALDETLYRDLRVDRGLRSALPLITLRLARGDEHIELVGTDPLAFTGGFAAASAPTMASDRLGELMTAEDAVLAPATLLERIGASGGRAFDVRAGDRTVTLRPVATYDVEPGDWFGDVLLADIATVQHLAHRRGEIDSIQLRLTNDEAEALGSALPPSVELRAFDAQRQTFDAMTGAFRTNLVAMSLLAVLVGAFLAYNTMTFAVVQRTGTFAILRMLGATPRQLFGRLLLEAAVLGSIGAVLGLVLGLFLGQSLLALVARTVSDLFVSIDAVRPDVEPLRLLGALVLTVGAVLLATLAPARDAARTAPVSLERQSTEGDRAAGAALLAPGLLLCLACPLILALSGRSLVAAFTALFALVAGYALLCPGVLRVLLRGLEYLASRSGSIGLRLAVRGVGSALPRTGPALVALAVAVAATVGVAIMIGSFRASVADWLDASLAGDLYVYRQGEGERLDPALAPRFAELPGVDAVSAARQQRLSVDGERLRVLVLDAAAADLRPYDIVAGPDDAARRVLRDGEGLLVSEPLARRRDLAVGDILRLDAPTGPVEATIHGVYRDYASAYGAAVLPLAVYRRHWRDDGVSTFALSLADNADSEAVRRRVDDVATVQALTVVSNAAIRERSLGIFDRTFVITEVLRALVVIVAFVGIVSALLALFLERRREFSVLRATGLTPRQLLALVLAQAGISGLLAGVLALPLGGLLSVLLIDVINRRSFGWTMNTVVDAGVMAQALLLAVTAAALAALLPARRLSRAELRDALYAP